MTNMFDMMKQAAQLKKQASHFQKILTEKTCCVSSHDNKITLKINGKMELVSIEISSDLLVPGNKVHIEKTILQTWHAAQAEMEKIVREELKSRMGDLPFGNLPF